MLNQIITHETTIPYSHFLVIGYRLDGVNEVWPLGRSAATSLNRNSITVATIVAIFFVVVTG